MQVFLICLSILPALISSGFHDVTHGERISGGEVALEGELPWQVSLQGEEDTYYCGGAIISERFILTAATCTFWNLTTVGSGSVLMYDPLNLHQTVFLFLHPAFNYSGDPTNIHHHNIAIIMVEPPFVFDNVTAPIILPEANMVTEEGTTGIVSGWGSTEWSGEPSNELLKAEVMVTSREDCDSSYDVTSGALCTKPGPNDENACLNDAGGPLTVSGELRGLVSLGHGCAQLPRQPTLYTDVAFYRDWIYETIGV